MDEGHLHRLASRALQLQEKMCRSAVASAPVCSSPATSPRGEMLAATAADLIMARDPIFTGPGGQSTEHGCMAPSNVMRTGGDEGHLHRVTSRALQLQEKMCHSAGASAPIYSSTAIGPRTETLAATAADLIMARDPIFTSNAGQSTEHGCMAPSNYMRAREGVPSSSSSHLAVATRTPRDDLETSCCLRVTIGRVEILPDTRPAIQASKGASVQYSVPVCVTGDSVDAEDVVAAACRDVDESGSLLSFRHTSTHAMLLTAKTLPELIAKPLEVSLVLGKTGIVSDKTGSATSAAHSLPAATLGVASVLWHQVLLSHSQTYDATVDLICPFGDSVVGRLSFVISLHPGQTQATITQNPQAESLPHDLRDLKLRVILGSICLRGSLQGVQAVLKLGRGQELVAQVQATQLSTSAQFLSHGQFDFTAVSSQAVWQVDLHKGVCRSGPTPATIFLQLWRHPSATQKATYGKELIALTKIPLQGLLAHHIINELRQGGEICQQVKLIDEDLEIQSAATGASIGAVHVSLHVVTGVTETCAPLRSSCLATPEVMKNGEERNILRRTIATAIMKLASADVDVEDIIRGAGRDHSSQSKVSLEALRWALMQAIKGLTELESSALCSSIPDEVGDTLRLQGGCNDCLVVSAQSAIQFMRSLIVSVENSVDQLVWEMGSACNAVLCDLNAREPVAHLRLLDLRNLLQALDTNFSEDALFCLAKSLSPFDAKPDPDISANLLGSLVERRMETRYQNETDVRMLCHEVLTILHDAYGRGHMCRLLQPYAKADGTMDRFGLAVALDDALRQEVRSSESGQMGCREAKPAFCRAQLDAVARSLLRLLGGSDECSVPIASLGRMLENAENPHLPSRPGPAFQFGFDTASRTVAPANISRCSYPNRPWQRQEHLPGRTVTSPRLLEPSSARNCRATLRLFLPISEQTLRADFVRILEDSATYSLGISPGRIRVVRTTVGSEDVELEIVPGLPGDPDPMSIFHAFARLLAETRSPLRAGPIGNVLVHAKLLPRLDEYTNIHDGTQRPGTSPRQAPASPRSPGSHELVLQQLFTRLSHALELGTHHMAEVVHVLDQAAQEVSGHFPELWCAQDSLNLAELLAFVDADPHGAKVAVAAWARLDLHASAHVAVAALRKVSHATSPHVLRVAEDDLRMALLMENRSSGNDTDPCVMSLQERIFEVISKSGVEPAQGFALLDQDDDGFISPRDFVLMLAAIDMPLSPAEVERCSNPMTYERKIDLAEFVQRYVDWLTNRDQFGGRPTPDRSSNSACLDLPSFIVFAMLDETGRGEVEADEIQRFAIKCLGLAAGAAAQAASACDLGGRGVVTYRDFRKYLNRLDRERLEQLTQEEALLLGSLRASARNVLELVAQPPKSAKGADAEAMVEGALKNRGRNLDAQVDATGFIELLEDLRLPSRAASAIARAWSDVNSTLASADGSSRQATYRNLLHVMRRALVFLRGHLDTLYGRCMAVRADLSSIFDFATRSPDQMLQVTDMAEVLESNGVNMNSVDLEDVLLVLDPHHRQLISAPELINGYGQFKTRHATLLGTLAGHLNSRGLTLDELFARTKRAQDSGARTFI